MRRIINYIAVFTIPSSLTINISNLVEQREVVAFWFSFVLSVIALISGIFALKYWIIKKNMAQIELDQKKEELKQKKEDREKKEKEPAKTGFFKNNLNK